MPIEPPTSTCCTRALEESCLCSLSIGEPALGHFDVPIAELRPDEIVDRARSFAEMVALQAGRYRSPRCLPTGSESTGPLAARFRCLLPGHGIPSRLSRMKRAAFQILLAKLRPPRSVPNPAWLSCTSGPRSARGRREEGLLALRAGHLLRPHVHVLLLDWHQRCRNAGRCCRPACGCPASRWPCCTMMKRRASVP